MRDAFRKALVPGLEYALGSKSMFLVVVHEDAITLFDHWDGIFKQETYKVPERQADINQERKDQMALKLWGTEARGACQWG
jgi:hypothetical protein